MGKSSQYRNWAITWKSSEHILPTTTRDGVRMSTGGYDYVIYVGPKESPDNECSSDHQHVMVHCETSNVSKKKATEAMVAYSSLETEVVQECIVYLRKVDKKFNYLTYVFKNLDLSTTCMDDDIVKNTINDLKLTGIIPTSNSIKRKLIDDHGANAFNKRFCKIAETYLAETDVVDIRGNPKVDLDYRKNRLNFISQMLMFYELLRHTSGLTMAKPFTVLTDTLLKDAAYLISLLPYFTKRVIGTNDNIPSLYFYGIHGAGKSSMFNNCRYIKKVATDASGVSRFRMDKMHTALLFDDIDYNTINLRENSSTLKQLTLGNEVEIKISGATQSIKGFIIVTSNQEPAFINKIEFADPNNKTIDEINLQIVNASWLRRFIILKFDKQCPFDLPSINYNDFHLRDLASRMFRKKYVEMISNNEEYEKQLKDFKIYYDVAVDDYSNENFEEEFDELFEEACDIVNEKLADSNCIALMKNGQKAYDFNPIKDKKESKEKTESDKVKVLAEYNVDDSKYKTCNNDCKSYDDHVLKCM